MTKSKEKGENEITDEAIREAMRRKVHVCDILSEMLAQAQNDGDADRVQKIIKAQKYKKCRNIKKRESNQ